MKIIEKKNWLGRLRERAKILAPLTAERLIKTFDAMEANLTPENEKILAKMVLDSRLDPGVMAELSQLRVIAADNFILATANALAFFDTVTLGPNEVPYIENTSRQQISVAYIGQDGKTLKTQPLRFEDQAQIQLHLLSTEEYEYRLKDMLKGNVADSSKANIDMNYDMTMTINALAWPFIKALIGNFTTGNLAKSKNTYVLHSSINVNNIPKSNLLYPTDVVPPGTASGDVAALVAAQSTTTMFGKTCMDSILNYCAAWGDNAFREGPLRPRAVYVPSSEIMGFLQAITLTSFPNDQVEKIMQSGFPMHYAGVDWVFIPDATLDPNAGLAYVRLNRQIGTFFTKPFMDDVIEDNSVEMRKTNKGSVSMMKAVGWGIPNSSAAYICAVQYHKGR